ncbi:GNAT family N-acetyltransferase [Alteribacter aurantiacus]|uniref:GNAT family N-acetyltransferase n=1 Tax=Alteribacter aurantiacus TaxID=254410 RepID=UPI00047E3AB0|nr:GNAT family N-acetyltransferase [Alteribacter aurantiacus]
MIYDKSQNTLTTDRLLLRPFNRLDATRVTKHCNNYRIYRHTLYLPYPYLKEHALTWIDTHQNNFKLDKSYEYAVTLKKDGDLVGAIALTNNQAFHHGELAYWIGEEYWGQGYATEAAQGIVDFAFREKEYHKVFARCFQSNPGSEKVLKKVGMKKEGVLKDHVFKEGQYESLIYYGLVKGEI